MPASPGLLAVWNDIAAEDEAEFNAWYVEEHVPERLGVPGILSARRYRDDAEAMLDAPLARVCSEEVPMPYAKHMEQAALPQAEKIVAAAKGLFG